MRNTLFAVNILLFLVLATILLFVPDVVGPLRIRWPVWMALLLLLAFGGVVLVIRRLERKIRERIKARLRERPALDSDAFAEKFYETEPETGGRVRDILAANLNLNLNGLRPEDRLNDDLDADLVANPDLFNELDRAFGVSIPTGPADLARHAELIVTFDDLVQYVVRLQGRGDSSAN